MVVNDCITTLMKIAYNILFLFILSCLGSVFSSLFEFQSSPGLKSSEIRHLIHIFGIKAYYLFLGRIVTEPLTLGWTSTLICSFNLDPGILLASLLLQYFRNE